MAGIEPTAVRPLEARVALVTGGSRGIGFAVASAFVDAGAAVAIAARSAGEVERAIGRLRERGGRVHGAVGDVADRAFCAALCAGTEAALGPVDVLVNNAAIQGPIGLLEELAPERWLETFAIDLHAPVWLMQALIPGMKVRRRGVILNVSGGGATGARQRFSAYAAAKTALVRLTETAAAELAPFGVRVNAVAPGAVNTAMTDEIERAGAAAGAAAASEVVRQRAQGGTPPELAAALMVFLASDAAAGISGRLISAVWDDWRAMQAGQAPPLETEWYTLRRVTPR